MKKKIKTNVTININSNKTYEMHQLLETGANYSAEDLMIMRCLIQQMGEALINKIEKEMLTGRKE